MPRGRPGTAPQAGARNGSEGFPGPGVGAGVGAPVRSVAGALAPGCPSTMSPHARSSQGWPPFGARARPGPSREGGHRTPG